MAVFQAADRGSTRLPTEFGWGSSVCGPMRVHRADSGVGVRLSTRAAVLATVVAVVTFSAAVYTVVTTGLDVDFGYEGATLGVADFGGGGDFEGDAGVTALLV